MTVGRHILLQGRRIGGGGGPPPVPSGAIAMWSGTLATIPANWSLCDGTGGTPNLVARFLRGAPAATDPGTTGGADFHTHASMTANGSHTHTAGILNHNHVTNSAGVHQHVIVDIHGGGVTNIIMDAPVGGHQHTTNNASHSHTMDTTANHSHTINNADGRPPYYEVAFIQAAAGAIVAANLIIIWTGLLANIPAGWTLCDGGGARPELRTRFLRGVNTNVTNPGTTGGNTTHLHVEDAVAAHSHTMNNAAAHFHTHTLYTWTHNHDRAQGIATGFAWDQNDTHAGDHTHANTDTIDTHNHNALGNDGAHAHTVNTASSLPTYYDVAYIINDGGATTIPASGILVWTGLLANIPLGYNLCDGGGGRPELRGKFLRGSAAGVDPGGEAGSDTHTHTDQNDGAHNSHSQTAAGAHQHTVTDTIGVHTHSVTGSTGSPGGSAIFNALDGDHSHTYNNEGAHSNHVLTDPGDHITGAPTTGVRITTK